MSIEAGEKFIKREPKDEKRKVTPEQIEQKISSEAKDWLNKSGDYLSSTDLEMIKNLMGPKQIQIQPEEAEFLKILEIPKEMLMAPKEKADIWKKTIKGEINKRWGDKFWEDMDPRLTVLMNKKKDIAREQGGGKWKNVPKETQEAWERKKDGLFLLINQHKEELRKTAKRKHQKSIEDIEQI